MGFAILIGALIFGTCIVLPWVTFARLQKLEDNFARFQVTLEARFKALSAASSLRETTSQAQTGRDAAGARGSVAEPAATPPSDPLMPRDFPLEPLSMAPLPLEDANSGGRRPDASPAFVAAGGSKQVSPLPSLGKKSQTARPFSLEQQFSGKAFVWLGGIALALAGFFMVKYSIETGLLSPAVRVGLGIFFGVGLLIAGASVQARPGISNGTRIAQSLSGAGIADLYACLYAATSLYHLASPVIGFVSMAFVTAAAVLLAVRQGAPIAVLGLIGGFLTPALISTDDPSAPLLFLYLYLVLAGLLLVIRRCGYWWLALPAVLGSFLWVGLFLTSASYLPEDAAPLGLFLLALSTTVAAVSRSPNGTGISSAAPRRYGFLDSDQILNYTALIGSLILMGIVAAFSHFELTDWVLFGTLSAGGIALAFLDPKRYRDVPFAAAAINVAMLAGWTPIFFDEFAWITASFAMLFIVSGWLLQSRSPKPFLWASLASGSSLAYYTVAYFQLRYEMPFDRIPHLWGSVALLFTGLSLFALQDVIRRTDNTQPDKEKVLATYAGVATAFLSIALAVEISKEFLPVAFALEVLALAWINTRLELRALRKICALVAAAFAVLMLPQILLLLELTLYSLTETELRLQATVPFVSAPLVQLGLPGLCFAVASILLRKKGDAEVAPVFEVAAVTLIGVTGYYLTRNAFHIDQNVLFVKAGFIERGIITNILMVYGLACLVAGRVFLRRTLSICGLILIGTGLFRIGYFDLLLYNPFWSAQKVGAWPLLNALLLTYGVPVLWTAAAERELRFFAKVNIRNFGYGAILIMVFSLVSLEVRQFYHGTLLVGGHVSDTEIYSYSAAWLISGIGLLVIGAWKKNRMLRVASLVLLLVTVGKVFLFDASQLAGLLRVFSFFGLGLSLLALSWFYARFVFTNSGEEGAPVQDP